MGLIQAFKTPLPLSVAGVKVTVSDITAPLFFISPNQIGMQVPYEVAPGAQDLVVTVNDKPSAPVKVNRRPRLHGHGYKVIANRTGVPRSTVRRVLKGAENMPKTQSLNPTQSIPVDAVL
jgi:hypothetical protein